MAILSPIHVLGPVIFLVVSIPLILFAALTTSLAITALTVRGSIVYIELAIAVLQSYIFTVPLRWQSKPKPKSNPTTRPITPVPQQPSPPQHRRGAPSIASSADLTTSQDSLLLPNGKTDSWSSLLGAGLPGRDYEGVGGWRISSPNDDDDALWLGMNMRLELPAPNAERPSRHRRSLTGASQRFSWSPDVRMSPVQGRTRTPSVAGEGRGEYFDMVAAATPGVGGQGAGSAVAGKGLEPPVVAKVKDEARRKSVGGSSTSSGASSIRTSLSGPKPTSYG